MRRTTIAALTTAALVAGPMLSTPAHAATEEQVVGGLITPLSLAVADDGTVYVANNFAGFLTRAVPGAEPEAVFADEDGREVGAVSVDGETVSFATTGNDPDHPDALLWTLDAEGEATEVADLGAYEATHNPDAGRKYGIVGLKKKCKAQFHRSEKWMLPYRGIVESHPYATTTLNGTTYVADAAANAIFGVADGAVTTTAVLPPTRIVLTRKVRRGLGLPTCTKGKTFKVEPVPTDVEAGPDGNLYVTSLPGGPEDPSLGARGSVYRVSPASGAVTKVADGLMSPTGLAIGPDGTAYVSMLFAHQIVMLPVGGTPSVLAEVPTPGDVEIHDGYVYATATGLFDDPSGPPSGQVLRWAVSD